MTFRLQKILVISGFILVIIGVAFGLYYMFFRKPATAPITSPPISEAPATGGTLPSTNIAGERIVGKPTIPGTLPVSKIAKGGITSTTALTLTNVQSPVLAADGKTMNFFNPADGKFYNVDADGKMRALLPKSYPNAQSIVWSPSSDKAVLEFPDGSNVSVNLQTGKSVTLPAHWEDFDFSPNGEGLATKSIGIDPSNRWLILSSPDGSKTESIAALGNNQDKVQVSWSPNDQVVAFSATGDVQSGFGRKQILAIGKNEENLPGLIVEGFSFEPLWSTSGKKILYSTSGPSSNYLPQVWVTDGESNTLGQNRKSLPLQTWADKCTFTDDDTAYCAVPQNLPAGAGLQRQLAAGLPDTLYKVNTKSGQTSVVAVPENRTSMKNLSVSADSKYLFYQNARTGALEKMLLK